MGSERVIVADGVIFDMDGTLVDSTALVEKVWAAFAERHDIDLAELIAYAHGRRADDTLEYFLGAGARAEVGAADLAEARAAVQAHEIGVEGAVLEIPGAAAFVAAFDPADVALVTSAPLELARLRMREAGIPLPEVTITAEDVSAGKPDPEGYRAAARRLGHDPARVVIFEDADAGLQAARASGAQVVVVGTHDGPATENLPRIPDYRTTTVTRIPAGPYRIELPTP